MVHFSGYSIPAFGHILKSHENLGQTNRVEVRYNNTYYAGVITAQTEDSLTVQFDTAGWVNPAKKGSEQFSML